MILPKILIFHSIIVLNYLQLSRKYNQHLYAVSVAPQKIGIFKHKLIGIGGFTLLSHGENPIFSNIGLVTNWAHLYYFLVVVAKKKKFCKLNQIAQKQKGENQPSKKELSCQIETKSGFYFK